jgi:hypothetical protein
MPPKYDELCRNIQLWDSEDCSGVSGSSNNTMPPLRQHFLFIYSYILINLFIFLLIYLLICSLYDAVRISISNDRFISDIRRAESQNRGTCRSVNHLTVMLGKTTAQD